MKPMQKCKLQILTLVMAVVMATAGFLALFLGGGVLNSTKAYTTANKPASIGSLTLSDYDTRTDGALFDATVLQKLYAKLAGTSTATYNDAYSAVDRTSSSVTGALDAGSATWTQSRAKDFTQINGSNPFSIEFAGFTWNVMYATTNTTEGTTGDSITNANDLIVTLWMSDPASTSQWNSYYDANTGNDYPYNMYSTSKIRVQALNAGSQDGSATRYARSTTQRDQIISESTRKAHMFAPITLSQSVIGKKSLTRFLTTPSRVAYQEKENYVWAYVGRGYPYLAPNEAWGTPDTSLRYNGTGAWYGSGSSLNMNQVIAKNDYKEWINDTLWLPSMTETGYCGIFGNTAESGVSLWGIPISGGESAVRVLSTTDGSLLRSGSCDAAPNREYGLNPDGSLLLDPPTTARGVRPAIHLNLSKIVAAVELDDPTDITTTYNGSTQNVKTLYTAQSWYDAEWYEHTGDYVSVTCYNASGAIVTSVTNVGEYWTEVKITDNWINAVNAEVDAAASGWSPDRIAAEKAARKPRFKGTASSDGTHIESDTVRWFKITVNKADIDFSSVVWSASELEFNNTNQSVTIVSGLPDFLTVKSYDSGATGRLVGSYTAKVTDWNIDTTKAANYNVPTSTSELDKISYLTHSWQITKKKIEVDWQLPGRETSSGSKVFIPNLKDDTTVSIEYTYFASNGITPKTIAEIESEYSITERKTYQVCAKLKSSGATYNSSNSVLMESGRDVTTSGARRSFTTGDTKIPVTVRVSPDHVTYNGSAQPVTIAVDGASLTAADFVVTYTMKSGAPIPADKKDASGVPIGAGEYKAKIALNSSQEGTYAITGNTEFDYTIDKAEYDLSGFQWLDENNVQYSAPYKWEEGVSHTLRYDGTLPSGLTFAYSEATKDNVTGSNVGKYPIVVEFTNGDRDNYEDPENVEFEWEIVAGMLDLSAVKWNYDDNFVFKIEDGTTAEYEVYLENLPAELAPLIRYGGDTGKRFTAGRYTTTFTVDETDPMYKNFGTLNFPEAASSSLTWEIKALTFEKPTAPQTVTYRENGYTFDDIAGFPAGWEEYFDVTIVDSDENPISPTGGVLTVFDVDEYGVLIRFQAGMNTSVSGTADNVKWTDGTLGAYRVPFTVEPLVFEAAGWIERGENIRPNLDAEASALTEIAKYFDYVLVNAETEETLSATATLDYETVYTIALKLKPEFAGNVLVEYMGTRGEETAPYPFMTDVDPLAPPPTNFYRKPTDEEAHVYYRYTGKEVAFKLGAWFVEEKMQILARAGSAESLLKGTEEGDYIVRVGFKKGARSAWEPASAVPADRAPVTIIFTISKDAKLSDRFILKDGITVPFVFLYDDFSSVGVIEDYEFNADKLAYVSRLSLGDTLSALLSQFENGADITVYDLDGTTVITDYSTVVATGMYLRLMDGETMLNQLILSVLGEITGDGIINLKDKAQLNSYTLGTTKLAPAQLLASDITGDGIINLKDKAQLNSYTLGTNALPVTPITVPAPSSVSEVVENAEVAETPVLVSVVSVSEVAEVQPAHTTSAEVAKADCTTVATNHRAATPQFVFPPDSAKKKYLK